MVVDEVGSQSGVRRSSHPSGKRTFAFVSSAFLVLGIRIAGSVVVVAHTVVGKCMNDADMQADTLGVERV